MNQPNPQKEYRNRLIAAIQTQQRVITEQQGQIDTLTDGVAALLTGAGISRHPRFAALMKQAGTPDEAPATTTEQARQPDAKDDPTSPGAVPAPANTGVTPDAVTDLQNTNVTLPEDAPLDNLQDVTQPVAGTDAVDSGAVFNGDIQTGTPASNESMSQSPSGWTGSPGSTGRSQSSLGNERERFVASVRLARLQIAAGLVQGEDMAIGEAIAASATPLSEINAVSAALSAVAASQQATRQPSGEHRHLVPQSAPKTAGIVPSMQQSPATLPAVTGSRADEDQWGFGFTE